MSAYLFIWADFLFLCVAQLYASLSADKVKVKVDKVKAAGSTVDVKIQKVKGLSKEVNAILKGKSLGSVTIRPIVAQELLTSPTKTYSKEGQVYVKAKGSTAKAAYVYVPKISEIVNL